MVRPLRTRWLLLAVLASMLLASVPATAQAPGTTVGTETSVRVFDEGPLNPGRTTSLTVSVRYRYGQGAAAQDDTTVRVEVEDAPTWANVSLDPEVVTFPVPAQSATSGGNREALVTLNVTVSPRQPAFQGGDVQLRAVAEENGNMAGSEGTATYEVVPAYYARSRVTPPTPLVVHGGREARTVLEVQVTTNGPSRVALEVLARPENSILSLPGSFDVPGTPPGAPSAHGAVIGVRTPWIASEEGTLTLQLTPQHATREDALGRVVEVQIAVQGRSAVPGVGAVGPLGVLAAALVLRRRTSREG